MQAVSTRKLISINFNVFYTWFSVTGDLQCIPRSVVSEQRILLKAKHAFRCFFYFGVLVDCGLMPYIRSYGDEALVYSSMQRTGEARD